MNWRRRVFRDQDAHYRETFTQGADILESDLPIEVAEAIKVLMPSYLLFRK